MNLPNRLNDNTYLTKVELEVLSHKIKKEKKWQKKDDMYWLARLIEEVGELSESLLGRHKHPPELELKQIASISLNWMEKLNNKSSV